MRWISGGDLMYSDQLLEGFLLGSKLGDACFSRRTPRHNVNIAFKHAKDQFEYLQWKYDFLKKYNYLRFDKVIRMVNIKDGDTFQNWQDQFVFTTRSLPQLNKYCDYDIDDLLKYFNDMTLTIWILDDGNIYNKTCKIACGSLNIKTQNKLVDLLKVKYGFDCHLYTHPSKTTSNYINIKSKEYEKIKNIVYSVLPKNIDAVMKKFKDQEKFNRPKVKYHNSTLLKLSRPSGSQNWIDLRAAETIELKAGEFKLISLGVSIQLPKGYEANIVPRSSTFKNYGIIQTNGFAVIDNSYCGNGDIWKFPAYATRDTVIHENDRICQFRINQTQPSFDFEEVDELNSENRGGFGSTGV